MTIERFELTCLDADPDVVPVNDGQWVRYSDHVVEVERLERERDEKQAALQKIADEHLPYVEKLEQLLSCALDEHEMNEGQVLDNDQHWSVQARAALKETSHAEPDDVSREFCAGDKVTLLGAGRIYTYSRVHPSIEGNSIVECEDGDEMVFWTHNLQFAEPTTTEPVDYPEADGTDKED